MLPTPAQASHPRTMIRHHKVEHTPTESVAQQQNRVHCKHTGHAHAVCPPSTGHSEPRTKLFGDVSHSWGHKVATRTLSLRKQSIHVSSGKIACTMGHMPTFQDRQAALWTTLTSQAHTHTDKHTVNAHARAQSSRTEHRAQPRTGTKNSQPRRRTEHWAQPAKNKDRALGTAS